MTARENAIAAVISEAVSQCRTPREHEIVYYAANHLADVCLLTNARFERARFLKACGVVA